MPTLIGSPDAVPWAADPDAESWRRGRGALGGRLPGGTAGAHQHGGGNAATHRPIDLDFISGVLLVEAPARRTPCAVGATCRWGRRARYAGARSPTDVAAEHIWRSSDGRSDHVAADGGRLRLLHNGSADSGERFRGRSAGGREERFDRRRVQLRVARAAHLPRRVHREHRGADVDRGDPESSAAVIGPIVDPQGRSLRTSNCWHGHARLLAGRAGTSAAPARRWRSGGCALTLSTGPPFSATWCCGSCRSG